MHIPTEDKLFDHACSFKDMKLSAFNPRSLTYYCQICGGKFIVEKDMKDWGELFGEPITLKLSKRVLDKVLEDREVKEQEEEALILQKEKEAMARAEEARHKAEFARKQDEEEKQKKMQELQKEAEEAMRREAEEAARTSADQPQPEEE
ncbi:MAG: hypothetical protein LWY06_08615 [Firmicutes bacterium]|nr:hypothetical protein [Bacillota bacterium]